MVGGYADGAVLPCAIIRRLVCGDVAVVESLDAPVGSCAVLLLCCDVAVAES